MTGNSMYARAFWLTTPGQGEIRVETLNAPGPNEAQVRTLFTGISRGTESRVFRGEAPPSQYQACLLYTSRCV